MTEKPPTPSEKPVETMTLAELDAKIQELTLAYERIIVSDHGTAQLTAVMARTINDRAEYEMRLQKLLSEGKEE